METTMDQVYSVPGFADPVSSWTHLVGAGVYGVLSVWLLRRGRGRPGRVFSLGVFAFTCVSLLAISGVYHLLGPGSGRDVMRRLDHDAIFGLIAGTFTPIHAILFRGPRRWAPLVLIWVLGVTGITLKTIFFASIPEWLGLAFYLMMGWMGLVSAWIIGREYGTAALRLPLAGGAAYTVGAVFEFTRYPVLIRGVLGPHELFHIAVLIGIGLFWSYIYSFADGNLAVLRSPRGSSSRAGGDTMSARETIPSEANSADSHPRV